MTTLAYVQTACGCSEATLLASLPTPNLPANESWAMRYGPEGRLASTTDPDGNQTGSGLSGAYAQQIFAWTPDLPDPTVTFVESDYPGHYDTGSFSYNKSTTCSRPLAIVKRAKA